MQRALFLLCALAACAPPTLAPAQTSAPTYQGGVIPREPQPVPPVLICRPQWPNGSVCTQS